MNAQTGKRRTLVLLLLALAVLAAAALVLDLFHLPLDLTSEGRYSLSPVTKKLAKGLEDQVAITYFVSPELEARHPGPRQIADYLRKFEAAGQGSISVEVANPAADAGAVEALGLYPQRMQVLENNEARVAMVYSGIVVEYRGRFEAVPFVISLDGLEYDVVKAIERVVSGKAQIAAVLVGDEGKSWQNDYQNLAQALQASGWQAIPVNPGDAVPAGASVLLVLGNSGLDDYAAYRVDSWLASGGATFMAVRGVDVDASQGLYAAPLRQDALLRSLEAYGVSVGRKLVLDVSARTLPFQEQSAGGGQGVRYLRYPHWIVVRGEDTDRTSPMTSSFGGLDLMWPSPLELKAPAGVAVTPLARTTGKAWLQTKDFAIAPEEDLRYAEEQPATTGQYTLAASLVGVLPMAYAGKAPPIREGAQALPPLPAQAKASRLVVVGSADFPSDIMNFTESLYNASFASNAVEWAAWGDELAALKARGARDPRLSRIQDPVRKGSVELFAMALNLLVIPAGLAVFGIVRIRRRKALAIAGAAPPASAATPEIETAEKDENGKGDLQ